VVNAPPVVEPVAIDTANVAETVAPVLEEPVKNDTIQIIEEAPVVKDSVQTLPPVEPEVKNEEPPVVEKLVVKNERHEVVTKGDDKDELSTSHYVIVGAFGERANAASYSERLNAAGHNSYFGFITQKKVYYVYVFKSNNLEETRGVRDAYRKRRDFQFPASWVLTVLE
jgi:cell division protein FtsN